MLWSGGCLVGAIRLLQEGICSYYLSLAVIYIAHDSTDGQADAMARWDNHSSEGWNRRCCSWRKRAAHGERWMELVVEWRDEQEMFKRINLTVSKKGSPADCGTLQDVGRAGVFMGAGQVKERVPIWPREKNLSCWYCVYRRTVLLLYCWKQS